MEVKYLKDHNDQKAGSVQDVTPDRANYLVRCQVAEYVDGSEAKPKAPKTAKQSKEPKQTKELKQNLETK